MFAARGIHAVVGAEHHASLLGPLGGGFLSLDIWVATEDAEDAGALLRDLRERAAGGDELRDGEPVAGYEGDPELDGEALDRRGPGASDFSGDDGRDTDADPDADPDADAEEEDEGDASVAAALPARIERRRRTSLVLLLGCCITFGTGHMAAGAGGRGLALAALELLGLLYLWAGHGAGLGPVVAAVVADVAGALWIVHRAPRTTLPPARVRRSRSRSRSRSRRSTSQARTAGPSGRT
jgi:hypothetical protein